MCRVDGDVDDYSIIQTGGLKMKNIKKIILAAMLLLPANVFAQGNMIGTAPLLDGLGVVNLYYQGKINDSSAWVVGYSSVSGSFGGGTITATMFSGGYKGYFSNYADGGYWQVGAGFLDVSSASGSLFNVGTAVIPFATVGYEATMGSNFVLGGEAGLGTGLGWGFLGVNAAYMF